MKWEQFLSAAYPNDLALEESHRGMVYRANRWVGIRFAYAFHRLGISANFISVMRLFISVVSLFLISTIRDGNTWLPVVGVLLLAWQVNLDFADGAVARLQGKACKIGEEIDGLANAASRAAILVLLGILTGNTYMTIVGAFSAYVVVVFGQKIRISTPSKQYMAQEFVSRKLLSVIVMVLVLPTIIVLHGILGWNVVVFAYCVSGVYAGLSVRCLVMCICKAGELEANTT